jgi:hypothetical protein
VLDWAIGSLQTLVVLFFLFPTLAVYAQIPTDEDADAAVTEDHRYAFPPTRNPKHGAHVVPHLGQLRSMYLQQRGFRALPVPGGVGSGTLYKQGALRASAESALRTHMIVYPEGMTLPQNWLFTTATNRTEKTVEVVGIFFGSEKESIGVFDWSCLPDWPCPNGETGPSWQWTYPLAEQPCYVAEDRTAATTQRFQWLVYQNQSQSRKERGTNPPLWRNTVKFWNYCTRVWDLVYTHTFRVDQKDCSLDSACGWWGPIIETFFDGLQPPIQPLWLSKRALLHDGQKSDLGPDETDFVQPAPPWQTYYLQPNDSWVVGP